MCSLGSHALGSAYLTLPKIGAVCASCYIDLKVEPGLRAVSGDAVLVSRPAVSPTLSMPGARRLGKTRATRMMVLGV